MRGLRAEFQAAEDRTRPRANPGDERDAVRPRGMLEDDVENNEYCAEPKR